MRERNQDPLAFVANRIDDTLSANTLSVFLQQSQLLTTIFTITTWINSTQSTLYSLSITYYNFIIHLPPSPYISVSNDHQNIKTVPIVIPQVAYQSPQAPTQLMTESPFVDSGFVVPMFSPRDDPIACLNKAMGFLTAVASSRFPSTNNQLRTSSNPRNQATIQDGRVTVQQVQGRQGQIIWQCTQPKRPRNAAWYKEKAMIAEAQEVEHYWMRRNSHFFREKMIDSQMDDMIRGKLALKEQVESLKQNVTPPDGGLDGIRVRGLEWWWFRLTAAGCGCRGGDSSGGDEADDGMVMRVVVLMAAVGGCGGVVGVGSDDGGGVVVGWRWWRQSGVVVTGEMEAEMMVVARWRGAVDLAEAAGRGDGGEGAAASGIMDRVDPGLIYLFCIIFVVRRKSSPEKFSGGGWPEKVAVAGGEGCRKMGGGERGSYSVCVYFV
ncbi:hypothetical protein Tco_0671249 [Tanacetum coccineum]